MARVAPGDSYQTAYNATPGLPGHPGPPSRGGVSAPYSTVQVVAVPNVLVAPTFQGWNGPCDRFCKVFLAIFDPPVAVALHRGCGTSVFINVILCCIFYIPGVIHAFMVIMS